jgi:hypothetical protein
MRRKVSIEIRMGVKRLIIYIALGGIPAEDGGWSVY